MPQLPQILSQASYSPTPEPSFGLNATSQVGEALQRSGAQMEDAFGRVAMQAARQQDAVDTADAFAKYQNAAGDLARKLQQDPDPASIPDRFGDLQDQLRQQALDAAPNDQVRARLAVNIDHARPIFRNDVLNTAFHRQQQANVATNQSTLSGLTQTLSVAPDIGQEEVAIESIGNTVGAGVATGLYSPEQGALMKSKALSTAILQRGVNDPVGAKTMLDRNRDRLQASDALMVDDRLRGPLNTATEWDLAKRSTQATGSPWQGAAGSDDETWQRVLQTESGGQQFAANGQPLTSSKGAIGVAQVMPETGQDVAARHGIPWDPQRLASDPAYNEQLGRLEYNDLLARYGGNTTLALAGYNAGPGNVDKWLSVNGDPRTGAVSDADWAARIPFAETRNYVGKIMGSSAKAPIAQRIDWIKQQGEAEGLSPQVIQGASAKALQEESQLRALQAGQLGQLRQDVTNLGAAYEHGVTATPIPEDRIHSLMEPEEAYRTIQRLQVSQDAGNLFQAVVDMSPADQQQARALLAVPGSLNATLPKRDGKLAMPAALPASTEEAPEQTTHRLAVASKLDALLASQHQMLRTDPGGFAAARPALADAVQAVQQAPNDPQAAQAYAAATLAYQAHLGVPDDQQRVLPLAQSAAIADTLKRTDPTKQDMGQVLDGMAQLYGSYWPKVQADLVRDGKLPAEWQVISAMDTPGQQVGRLAYQRALVEQQAAGGREKYQAKVPADALKDIRTGLEATVDPFRQTAVMSEGGKALYDNIRDAVELQAMRYAVNGLSGNNALMQAYSDVIGAKYDFDGTIRVPKGMLPAARVAVMRTTDGLKPEDLQPLADPSGLLTPAERSAATLTAARNGLWIPTPADDGLMLVARTRVGSIPLAMHRADGSPVAVKFADMAPATAQDTASYENLAPAVLLP
jgi:hypothetical protein